ncbi:hypothetical protein HP456_08310 [Bacillus haikouensis]|jgi:hypothetical protein|uniref:hypothetical protein n=1 Tax=Bacillus haikouensis TaxID=1510468 RepID=UPI0015527575|nr:hypothetical protein [Bacillus haikouensis]NQD65925.1 hypothetical protein [Bacillus haikouensis]
MGINTYHILLENYRSIWKNRLLPAGNKAPEVILKEAIMRELLDENSHPRVRKPLNAKYVSSAKRILESDLSPDSKIELLRLHIEMLELLNEEI